MTKFSRHVTITASKVINSTKLLFFKAFGLVAMETERVNGYHGESFMWSTIGQSLVVRDPSAGKLLMKTF